MRYNNIIKNYLFHLDYLSTDHRYFSNRTHDLSQFNDQGGN